SGVLGVVSAIERVGHAAVDVSRIVTRRLGIPAALVADLAAAEEVSHRVRVREASAMAHGRLSDLELPTEVGMRVMAVRRGKAWSIDPDGDFLLLPNDVLILRGPSGGISELRELAGAPEWRPPEVEGDPALSDLDRAIDVIVEMKNISEVAVGLAYSALLFNDQGLAAEVGHLEDRLDEMQERLQVWVLRAGATMIDPSALRGLLQLAQAAEEIGDAAQAMVWLVEKGEELHPVLAAALGESDEIIVSMPVAPGSPAEGHSLAELDLEVETGFYLLAIRRAGRYLYRPRGRARLMADDELVASGPDEGRALLAELCGFVLIISEDGEELELVPAGGQRARDAAIGSGRYSQPRR
ncbi:MAG: potassium channel family protein, partial [Acidimicrobiia bacterium]